MEKCYTDGEVGDDNLIVEDIQVAGETNADRIIRIINKIKDKRNRANYSSIFDKVHKENPNINMATTKQIIHNLIQQNIIVDISRSDNEESFKMVEVKNITHLNNNKNKTNTLDTNTNIKNTVNKSTVNKINSIKDSDINKINDLNANKTDYNNDSLNDIGDYINDKFYNVLQDMIKKEVSESIKNTIPNPDSIIKDSKSINDSKISNNKYSQDIMNFQMKEMERLRNQLNSQRDEILKEISVTNSNNLIHINQTIESQKKDIEFLRSQLVNKDKTIQLLISEKTCVQKNNNISQVTASGNTIMCDTKNDFINPNGKKVKETSSNRSVLIIGDSMIREISSDKVRKGLGTNKKIYVKSFPGASTSDMYHYTKPAKEYENDMIILHC